MLISVVYISGEYKNGTEVCVYKLCSDSGYFAIGTFPLAHFPRTMTFTACNGVLGVLFATVSMADATSTIHTLGFMRSRTKLYESTSKFVCPTIYSVLCVRHGC